MTEPRILKWEFTNAADDDWGLNESRGSACEFVAWQFLCHLNQHETIEFLLEELPIPRRNSTNLVEAEMGTSSFASTRGDPQYREGERTPLLLGSSFYRLFGGKYDLQSARDYGGTPASYQEALTTQKFSQFFGLNALEIAAIAHAKRFLGQRVVQRVVDDIWNGEIVFWDSLTVHSTKKPQMFNPR